MGKKQSISHQGARDQHLTLIATNLRGDANAMAAPTDGQKRPLPPTVCVRQFDLIESRAA